MYALVKNNVKVVCNKDSQAGFETIKTCLEVIKYLDCLTQISKLTSRQMQAIEGISAVLLQKLNVSFTPVQFTSKTHSSTQKRLRHDRQRGPCCIDWDGRVQGRPTGRYVSYSHCSQIVIHFLGGKRFASQFQCKITKMESTTEQVKLFSYLHTWKSNHISDSFLQLPLAELKDHIEPNK